MCVLLGGLAQAEMSLRLSLSFGQLLHHSRAISSGSSSSLKKEVGQDEKSKNRGEDLAGDRGGQWGTEVGNGHPQDVRLFITFLTLLGRHFGHATSPDRDVCEYRR